MKIIRNDQKALRPFGELKIGDVFIEECDGKEYIQMKIDECEYGGDDCNAVSLVTGEIYAVASLDMVRPVSAELVIND